MPSPVRFAEVQRLLESHGWTLSRIASSHHIFTKPGEPLHFSIPVHKGMVMHGYLKDIKKRLGIR
ncbi:MAG: type II toxin-antitoxin system HicA family toxin [Tepidisphaeraceae bacterium]